MRLAEGPAFSAEGGTEAGLAFIAPKPGDVVEPTALAEDRGAEAVSPELDGLQCRFRALAPAGRFGDLPGTGNERLVHVDGVDVPLWASEAGQLGGDVPGPEAEVDDDLARLHVDRSEDVRPAVVQPEELVVAIEPLGLDVDPVVLVVDAERSAVPVAGHEPLTGVTGEPPVPIPGIQAFDVAGRLHGTTMPHHRAMAHAVPNGSGQYRRNVSVPRDEQAGPLSVPGDSPPGPAPG